MQKSHFSFSLIALSHGYKNPLKTRDETEKKANKNILHIKIKMEMEMENRKAIK